ncbi:vitellogenin-6-like [Ornithodoros turicata]|uniref:vitellogenin-6-like n=1 Tax=Ornithodoros turicata TaxID=34597 RepID=UPI00313947C0
MKLLLGFLALVAAAVSTANGIGYEVGKEYVYEYVGKMYTHLPEMEQQVSGVIFKSKIIVQPKGQYLLIKPEDVVFEKVHKDVEDFEHKVFNYRTIGDLTENFTKPFKVFYDHGKVRNIQIGRTEPIWSINLKKSIASIFNLDLEAIQPILPKEEKFYGEDPRRYSHIHELPTSYRVYEDGLYGECETLYDVQTLPWPGTVFSTVLNVTKVKNLEECRNTPYIFFGEKHGYKCVECEGDETHPITSNVAYHYNIKGTRHSFIIETVKADGEVMYTPYTPEGNVIRMLLNRTLTLTEVHDVRLDIHMVPDLFTYNDLVYEFVDPKFKGRIVDLKATHPLVATYGLHADVDEVGRLFRTLADFYYEEGDVPVAIQKEQIPVKFLQLIYAFVLLDYQQIDDFYHKFVETGSEEEKEVYKDVFADLLKVVGTNPSFLYSKHLIHTKRIGEDEAIEILRGMPLHIREPSEILFDEYYRLCEGSSVRDNKNLHSACLLGFSTLVFETCIAKYHNTWNAGKEKVICTPAVAAKYFNYLVPQYERDLETYDRLTYIKVAGNFAVKEALPYLEKYADDTAHRYPKYVRMAAIWALAKVASFYPEKVREIVLPMYNNYTESHEVRLGSFIVLMKTNPDLYLLKAIVAGLLKEPNTQVITYVWTMFKYLQKSTHPCHFEVAQKLWYALPIAANNETINKEKFDWAYSQFYMDAGYEPKYDYGGYTQLSYIMADDSYLPRSIFFKENDYKNNFNYDTFSMSFEGWGLDGILDKVFGPKIKGDVSPSRSLWNYFGGRRSTRDITANKEVKEIDQSLHIEPREYEEPFGTFKFELFNNEIAFWTFNRTTFEHIFGEEERSLPWIRSFAGDVKDFKITSFDMQHDMSFFLPTEIGLPFYLEYKEPTFFYYKNKDITFDVKTNPDDNTVTEVGAKVHAHVMLDSHAIETVSILVPFEKVSVGVGYESRTAVSVPVNIEGSVDLIGHKFGLKSKPQIPHDVFYYDFKPFSYIEDYENALPVVHEDTKIDFFREEDLHKFEKEYLHEVLGVGIKVDGHYIETPDFWGSWKKFWHTNDFRQKYYYLYENPHWHPRKLRVGLTPANRDVTNEIEVVFDWSTLTPETRGNTIFKSKLFPTEADGTFPIKDELKSYTTVIDTEIFLRGQKERKISSEIIYTRTKDLLLHNINFFVTRTPFKVTETDDTKICFHGSAKFPVIDEDTVDDLNVLTLDNVISTNFDLFFGKDCKTDQKVVLRGIWEHTVEQKYLLETRELEEPVGKFLKNPYKETWKKCLRYREKGVLWNKFCLIHLYEASKLNHFKGDLEYENLSEQFLWYVNYIRRYIRHKYFPWVHHVDDLHVNNPEGRVHVAANFSYYDPVVDVELRLPHENIYYKQAPVPEWIVTPRHYNFLEYTMLSEYSTLYRHRNCDVQGPSIKTFDGVFYDLPDTDCFKVLAKDCSPHEHFLVLGAKTHNVNFQKALRMFISTFKIEIMPVTPDTEPIVRINGKKVPITIEEPFKQYINTGVRDVELFNIERLGQNHLYKLVSEIYGLRIFYDGQGIFVQVAPYYRGKVCGLCGDYNMNKFKELVGPDKCEHYNTTTFGYSYVIPSSECTAPEYKSPCTIKPGETCTVMRTKTIELGTGKNRQVCFSIAPVAHCSDSCIETRYVTREVSFHCLPAKDATTRNLVAQSKVRPLMEFRRKREDHRAVIEYPEGCYKP